MKLTNAMRQQFVSAVMKDVPRHDYKGQRQKVVEDYVVSQMPAKVRAVYDDKELRDRLTHICIYQQVGNPIYVRGAPGVLHFPVEVTQEANRLEGLRVEQGLECGRLRAQLEGVANACTTLSALEKALPEMKKYMPQGEVKVTTLPAIANLVADFAKAGWPNGKPPEPAPTQVEIKAEARAARKAGRKVAA